MIPDILRIWGAAPTSNVGLIWVLNIFLFSLSWQPSDNTGTKESASHPHPLAKGDATRL